MFTAAFWRDAVERAIKTAAQTAVGLLVALNVAADMDWTAWAVGLGIATGLSFVTSILSSLAGSNQSASLVDGNTP